MILQDFVRRSVASVISIVVVCGLLFFADLAFVRYLVLATVAGLTGVAIWEYEQFAKAKGGKTILPVLIMIGVFQVISFFASAVWAVPGNLPLFCFFLGFLILIAVHFKEQNGAVVDLAVSTFGLLYIAVPMGMLLAILYGREGGQDGRWWLAYLIVVTKITDIGAYFGGSLWGRRKLAPKISPGKTVEGAIIGLICAIVASFVFAFISAASGAIRFHLSLVEAMCLGVVLGCIGQFGDLSESLLKRDANKKDSNALPGLGGVLDMIDSLLFNVIIVYFYIKHSLL
jgi:phosphatidate cytidylyltransferase